VNYTLSVPNITIWANAIREIVIICATGSIVRFLMKPPLNRRQTPNGPARAC